MLICVINIVWSGESHSFGNVCSYWNDSNAAKPFVCTRMGNFNEWIENRWVYEGINEAIDVMLTANMTVK